MENHTESKTYTGSCHCGAVRFEVKLDPSKGSMCNCSACQKFGALSAMVKPAAFHLTSGPEHLGEYSWGAKLSKRCFCTRCGVQCFGVGHLEQLGGDYVSINLNVLDGVDPAKVATTHWDGRHDNWQAGTRAERWPI